jgi:hypothetical protein
LIALFHSPRLGTDLNNEVLSRGVMCLSMDKPFPVRFDKYCAKPSIAHRVIAREPFKDHNSDENSDTITQQNNSLHTFDWPCFTTSTSEASRPPSLTSKATIIAIDQPEHCQSRRRLFVPPRAAPRTRTRRKSFLSNSTHYSRAFTRWDSPRFQSLGYLTGGLSLSMIRMRS